MASKFLFISLISLLSPFAFPQVAAILQGYDVHQWIPPVKMTASVVIDMNPGSTNRLGTGTLIHPRFFLTTKAITNNGVGAMTVRVGSLRQFEFGEVRKVDFCNAEPKSVTNTDNYRVATCRLKIPFTYAKFGYLPMTVWWKPRGFDVGEDVWQKQGISGWHGWEDNWVNHKMNIVGVKEVSNNANCRSWFYNIDEMMGHGDVNKYYDCYMDAALSSVRPEPMPNFAANWDDGAPVAVKGTQLVISIALGKLTPTDWGRGRPSIGASLENIERELSATRIEWDRDDFWGFPEFFMDPNDRPLED